MRREGMSQRMWRRIRRQTKPSAQPLHECLRLAWAHRLAAPGNKKRGIPLRRKRADFRVCVDGFAHRGNHWNGTLFAALAENRECLAQGRIAALEAERLRYAQTRAVKQ